jgi:hypothetical protein
MRLDVCTTIQLSDFHFVPFVSWSENASKDQHWGAFLRVHSAGPGVLLLCIGCLLLERRETRFLLIPSATQPGKRSDYLASWRHLLCLARHTERVLRATSFIHQESEQLALFEPNPSFAVPTFSVGLGSLLNTSLHFPILSRNAPVGT